MEDRVELLRQMRLNGIEQTIPGIDRVVRLKTIEAIDLLKDDALPDILTPLVIRGVYQELKDAEVKDFLDGIREKKEDALALARSIDYICLRGITDGTPISDLTLGEKRWIFRLVLEPAELLINFRYESEDDVEPLDESEDLQPVAESDTEA